MEMVVNPVLRRLWNCRNSHAGVTVNLEVFTCAKDAAPSVCLRMSAVWISGARRASSSSRA
jgi:hypothetical protein